MLRSVCEFGKCKVDEFCLDSGKNFVGKEININWVSTYQLQQIGIRTKFSIGLWKITLKEKEEDTSVPNQTRDTNFTKLTSYEVYLVFTKHICFVNILLRELLWLNTSNFSYDAIFSCLQMPRISSISLFVLTAT